MKDQDVHMLTKQPSLLLACYWQQKNKAVQKGRAKGERWGEVQSEVQTYRNHCKFI